MKTKILIKSDGTIVKRHIVLTIYGTIKRL